VINTQTTEILILAFSAQGPHMQQRPCLQSLVIVRLNIRRVPAQFSHNLNPLLVFNSKYVSTFPMKH